MGLETCCGVWCGGVCDGMGWCLGFSGFSGFFVDSSVTCFNALPWKDCMVSILKSPVSEKKHPDNSDISMHTNVTKLALITIYHGTEYNNVSNIETYRAAISITKISHLTATGNEVISKY